MTLLRVFSIVDEKGSIFIPPNVQKELMLKSKQLVEIKVLGTKNAQYMVIHKRKDAR